MSSWSKSHVVRQSETSVPLLAASDDRYGDDYAMEEINVKSEEKRREAGTPRFTKRTPLPLMQLLILSAVRLAEPIAYTQIFPYINQMMEDLKVTDKPSEIGYYSGIVDSIFAVCQLFTIFHWGRLSDRIGRKPVLLIGLTGVALSSLSFGLSKTLLWAVIARSLAGALSGNVAVVQSVIGEITDATNQAQSFALTGVSWSLGCIIGPMIGGNFVKPADSWPNSFGTIPSFQEYPYLLPCLLSAVMTFASIGVGIVLLKESLPSKVRLDPSLPSPITSTDRMADKIKGVSKPKQNASVKFILSSPIIRTVFKNYFLLSVLGTAFDVVFILFSYTPVSLGGLSRNPEEIGYALAFSGVAGAIVQVFVFPVLQRRWNNIPLYRGLMTLWPILFGLLPCLQVIARWTAPPGAVSATTAAAIANGEIQDTHYAAGWPVWLGIAFILAILRCAHMSFALNVVLVKNAAPNKNSLGSTFGLAQSVACVARASSPAFVSSIFAISKKKNILGGNFVWLVMFCVSLLALWNTYSVRDGEAERENGGYALVGSEADEMQELQE